MTGAVRRAKTILGRYPWAKALFRRYRKASARLFGARRPPGDDLANYQAHFHETVLAFDRFLERCDRITPGDGDRPVGIVVMPWWGTPAPWWAVAAGLGLAERGRPVTFVSHDLAFPEPSEFLDLQIGEIGRVVGGLAPRFPVLRLSDGPPAPAGADDDALLDDLAAANLMWDLRGAVPTEEDRRRGDRMRRSLADALPRVRALLRDHRFEFLLVPGGVTSTSGLYLAEGRARGVRVATYDAGLGATAIDVDGVAAQHTDMPRAFRLLADELGGHDDDVVGAAREEFEARRSGSDPDAYQLARPGTASVREDRSVLVPLSVVFDAAALGLHHIFPDSEAWLVETVRAVLAQTDDPVVVRQHPSERRSNERSGFDARSILSEAFGSNPQLRFVAAEDDVSTYDLLDAARLVLPFVSTIGIEAAALGKPVIVSGSVYYAGLGFVWAPSTRDEYFDLLGRGARGELPTLPDQVDLAWRCYYLTAVCQRVWTDFTPQPPDFWRWVGRQPAALFRDPDVVDILASLDRNVPLAIVRHERRTRPASHRAAKP